MKTTQPCGVVNQPSAAQKHTQLSSTPHSPSTFHNQSSTRPVTFSKQLPTQISQPILQQQNRTQQNNRRNIQTKGQHQNNSPPHSQAGQQLFKTPKAQSSDELRISNKKVDYEMINQPYGAQQADSGYLPPTSAEKRQRRELRRSKTRSLSKDANIETYYEQHVFPLLINKLASQIIGQQISESLHKQQQKQSSIKAKLPGYSFGKSCVQQKGPSQVSAYRDVNRKSQRELENQKHVDRQLVKQTNNSKVFSAENLQVTGKQQQSQSALDQRPIAADFYVPGSEVGSYKLNQKWDESHNSQKGQKISGKKITSHSQESKRNSPSLKSSATLQKFNEAEQEDEVSDYQQISAYNDCRRALNSSQIEQRPIRQNLAESDILLQQQGNMISFPKLREQTAPNNQKRRRNVQNSTVLNQYPKSRQNSSGQHTTAQTQQYFKPQKSFNNYQSVNSPLLSGYLFSQKSNSPGSRNRNFVNSEQDLNAGCVDIQNQADEKYLYVKVNKRNIRNQRYNQDLQESPVLQKKMNPVSTQTTTNKDQPNLHNNTRKQPSNPHKKKTYLYQQQFYNTQETSHQENQKYFMSSQMSKKSRKSFTDNTHFMDYKFAPYNGFEPKVSQQNSILLSSNLISPRNTQHHHHQVLQQQQSLVETDSLQVREQPMVAAPAKVISPDLIQMSTSATPNFQAPVQNLCSSVISSQQDAHCNSVVADYLLQSKQSLTKQNNQPQQHSSGIVAESYIGGSFISQNEFNRVQTDLSKVEEKLLQSTLMKKDLLKMQVDRWRAKKANPDFQYTKKKYDRNNNHANNSLRSQPQSNSSGFEARRLNMSAGGVRQSSVSRSSNRARFVNTDTLQELLICKKTNSTTTATNVGGGLKQSFDDLSMAISAANQQSQQHQHQYHYLPSSMTPDTTSPLLILHRAPFEIRDLRPCERIQDSNKTATHGLLSYKNNGSYHNLKDDATSTASIRFKDNDSNSVLRSGVCGPSGQAVKGQQNAINNQRLPIYNGTYAANKPWNRKIMNNINSNNNNSSTSFPYRKQQSMPKRLPSDQQNGARMMMISHDQIEVNDVDQEDEDEDKLSTLSAKEQQE